MRGLNVTFLKEKAMVLSRGIAVAILCSTASMGQDPSVPMEEEGLGIAWSYNYGERGSSDVGYCLAPVPGGGFLAAGRTVGNWGRPASSTSEQLYVARTDADGKLLWQKPYFGIPSEVAWALFPEADGSFYLAGQTQVVGFDQHGYPWTGKDLGLLMRLDPDGNVLWRKQYDYEQSSYGFSVRWARRTADGGFILAGSRILKVAADGAVVWMLATFGGAFFPSEGDSLIVLNGKILDGVTSLYASKILSDGSTAWEKRLMNFGSSILAFAPTRDGGGLIGYSVDKSPGSGTDLYILRLGPEASMLWSRSFVLPGIHDRYSVSVIRELDDGTIFCAGYRTTSVSMTYLMKLGPDGAGIYDCVLPKPLGLNNLIVDRDGGIIFTGGSEVREGSVSFLFLKVGRSFRRGDANGDGRAGITDAIAILDALFRGKPLPPGCPDASDTNDDAKFNLSDVVQLLGALFLQAGPLPEPWAAAGADPTSDGLGCGEV